MNSAFRVGVSRTDITPPLGHIIHSGDKVAKGVGDPLFTNGASGDLKIAFVKEEGTKFACANGYCGYLPSARSIRHDGARPRYNWHKIVGSRTPMKRPSIWTTSARCDPGAPYPRRVQAGCKSWAFATTSSSGARAAHGRCSETP